MAIIKCEECGKEVSTKAASCPHCGAPQSSYKPTPAPRTSSTGTVIKTTVIVVVTLVALFFIATFGFSLTMCAGTQYVSNKVSDRMEEARIEHGLPPYHRSIS